MLDIVKSTGDIGVVMGDDYSTGEISANDSSGTAVDLSSGYTAKMEVRAAPGETAEITLTDSSGVTLADGSYTIELTAAETAAVSASGTYQYDLRITETASSEVLTIRKGKAVFTEPITELS